MSNKWVDKFLFVAESNGITYQIIRQSIGWTETAILNDKRCFTKSFTYNFHRKQYFQGVDPKKLDEAGDFVLLCGGANGQLKDIFIIPWNLFFNTLANGEPINTYREPKKYFQYKFYIRDRGAGWIMIVQGGLRPNLDINKWRYDTVSAISFFK